MNHTVATIVEGELDAADLLLLVAVILFIVGAVSAVARRAPGWALEHVMLLTGLAAMALALLLL